MGEIVEFKGKGQQSPQGENAQEPKGRPGRFPRRIPEKQDTRSEPQEVDMSQTAGDIKNAWESLLTREHGGIVGPQRAKARRDREAILEELHKRYPNGRKVGQEDESKPLSATQRRNLRTLK